VDNPHVFDCAIIGGGAAGLSAAMVLARSHRAAALIDNGRQSNLATLEAHSVFSRDKVAPAELYAIVREQLAKYISVVTMDDTALSVIKADAGFQVALAGGESLSCRVVLLAQGSSYELPQIPGIQDLWGRKVFHCPYCDGWEMTDKRLLAVGDEAWQESMSRTLPNWTRCLTWARPHEVRGLRDAQAGLLAELEAGLQIDWQQPTASEAKAEVLGREAQASQTFGAVGHQVEFDRVIVQTNCTVRDGIAVSLGCELNEKGQVVTDEQGRTSAAGVYAAGDIADQAKYINVAAASGTLAGVAINADLGKRG
jgi:thioredoxin reductase